MLKIKNAILAVLMAVLVLSILAPLPTEACSPGGGIIIIEYHRDGSVWITWIGLATVSPANMQACLVGIQSNGIIKSVDHVSLVETATGKPFPGLTFAPHRGITNRLGRITGAGSGEWHGFYARPRNPPAEGIEAEMHFDVRLEDGATLDDLAEMLQTTGLIANGSAAFNGKPDFHHFGIHRPHTIAMVDEDGEIRILGGKPRTIE